jgi:hypothetical protein
LLDKTFFLLISIHQVILRENFEAHSALDRALFLIGWFNLFPSGSFFLCVSQAPSQEPRTQEASLGRFYNLPPVCGGSRLSPQPLGFLPVIQSPSTIREFAGRWTYSACESVSSPGEVAVPCLSQPRLSESFRRLTASSSAAIFTTVRRCGATCSSARSNKVGFLGPDLDFSPHLVFRRYFRCEVISCGLFLV